MVRPDIRKTFDAVLGALDLAFTCSRCGGRSCLTSKMIVLYRGDPYPSRCRGCGFLLHADGKPAGHLGPGGKQVARIINLRGDYAWADPRPADPNARFDRCA